MVPEVAEMPADELDDGLPAIVHYNFIETTVAVRVAYKWPMDAYGAIATEVMVCERVVKDEDES